MAKNVKATISTETASLKAKKNKSDKSAKMTVKVNWRVDKKYFIDSCSSRIFQRGVENFSAGWLAQGHEVGDPFILHYYLFKY
jgi:hypothetical protein